MAYRPLLCLSELTPTELQARGAEYRAMAATASSTRIPSRGGCSLYLA